MPDFKMTEVAETPYIYVERSCSMDPSDISQAMGEAFGQVFGFMAEKGIAPAGPPMSVYYTYDPETMTFRSGFAVAADDMSKAADGVSADVLPAGRVLHFVHKGAYATLRDDYGLMMEHLKSEGLQIGAPTWEIYVNDPAEVPEEELLTEIYVALA